MARRILLSAMVLALAVAAVGAGTLALYSDTETSADNRFTAGTLDLTVDGSDDPLPMVWNAGDMEPGKSYDGGVVVVRNNGSVPGKVTLKVRNVVSNENSQLEPELAMTVDGLGPVNNSGRDIAGQEVDPTGWDNNGGDGELWDQMGLKFYVDSNNTGAFEWYEPVIWDNMALDMTGYYSIPIDTNLFPADHGFDETLDPGESFKIGLIYRFFNDAGSPMNSQPQFTGLNNNMAMSDDAVFDISFGLEQAP